MAELWHVFGNDLTINATGDLLLASGAEQTRQRIIRRLLTNQGDYIWHPTYGAGLGRFIGRPGNERQITGVIRAQVLQETSVARVPPPAVTVTNNGNNTYYAQIQYTDAATGIPQPVLTVPIDNTLI